MRIISGRFRGRRLNTCTGPGYRPATGKVRESLFSILESSGINWQGARVLDLFAGSGALGFEALSRGAEYALLIEKNRNAVNTLKKNLRDLDLAKDTCRVLAKDVLAFLNKPGDNPFDIVFIDPPYRLNMLQPTLKSLVNKGWVTSGSLIQAEIESELPTPTMESLIPVREKLYGQTKVCLWKKRSI